MAPFDTVESSPTLAALRSLVRELSLPEVRERQGTAAGLRRAISQLPAESAESEALTHAYVRAYSAALAESPLQFLHLSKSGGTGLCELSKLNGCSRASPGTSSLAGNNGRIHTAP